MTMAGREEPALEKILYHHIRDLRMVGRVVRVLVTAWCWMFGVQNIACARDFSKLLSVYLYSSKWVSNSPHSCWRWRLTGRGVPPTPVTPLRLCNFGSLTVTSQRSLGLLESQQLAFTCKICFWNWPPRGLLEEKVNECLAVFGEFYWLFKELPDCLLALGVLGRGL